MGCVNNAHPDQGDFHATKSGCFLHLKKDDTNSRSVSMGTEGESWASWSGILAQDQKLFGPVLRTRVVSLVVKIGNFPPKKMIHTYSKSLSGCVIHISA